MTEASPISAHDQSAKPNLTEQVYEQLIQILISGELRPGDVIVERKIADRLNASRTPVREALGRLEAERLVFKQPNRGVTVSPFSTEALIEILNVRQLLESEAARLAAGRIPADKIEKIRARMMELSEKSSVSLAETWEVDDQLHSAIAEASGNSLMAGLIRDLRRRTHVFNAYRNPHDSRFDAKENLFVLDMVASGDAEKARSAMYDHINSVKIAIINRLTGVSL
ncbi:GntR family transcriptional regulator [Celeribacter persicus]|jgi:Transcriptional regulators|uniref:DNA-binding GntR family transcriptional regulator n=1 Tax=Celeribacter persicus TaxID=1651082 RepID=A0A2T5H4D9_9RHOB|nr:GntR family transcriptional regulator [Celeribacter persicus]PTQ66379.1 DNA-binding GntR family transcriptional regulator [Celeribacter persicus]